MCVYVSLIRRNVYDYSSSITAGGPHHSVPARTLHQRLQNEGEDEDVSQTSHDATNMLSSILLSWRRLTA